MKEDLIAIVYFLGIIVIGMLYGIYTFGCNDFIFYLVMFLSAVLCAATIYLYKGDK